MKTWLQVLKLSRPNVSRAGLGLGVVALLMGYAAGCGGGDEQAVVDAEVASDAAEADANTPADVAEPPVCEGLFGRPSASTGLTAERCAPVCPCSDAVWEAPEYVAADLDALRAWTLLEPFAALTQDPYLLPAPEVSDAAVCAFVVVDAEARTYRLQDHATWEAAETAGAKVTHRGRCGLCSSLENLAAYIATPDLTAPVRDCGLKGMREGDDVNIACLQDLGFDLPCAQIWFHNTAHTRTACIEPCFALLGAPYHAADGSLNECLACDETISGPVFKAIAGRTRRNTGLASALCRPCAEVARILHRYP